MYCPTNPSQQSRKTTMDIPIWIAIIVAIIVIPTVMLWRPLIVAIANRIAGKQVNTEEIKLLKTKVALLEEQLMEMRSRVLSIEDTTEFSRKMLEDEQSKKTRS
jgi:hypothetical protein